MTLVPLLSTLSSGFDVVDMPALLSSFLEIWLEGRYSVSLHIVILCLSVATGVLDVL